MTTLAIIYLVTFALSVFFAVIENKDVSTLAALTTSLVGTALAIAALA